MRRWLTPTNRAAQCMPRGFDRALTLGQVGNKRLNFDALPGASKAPVDKVDACDASNPQCMIPYLQDIHRHYREAEVRRPALAKLSQREPRPTRGGGQRRG